GLGDVGTERRPRREQRALCAEDVDVEGFDLSRRRPEADEIAERLQAIERSGKRRLADAVIDDLAGLAAGDLLDALGEVLVAIEDDVIAAVLLGKVDLVGRPHGADHGGAKMLGPLAGDEADAAGGSVEQNGVPLLDT